MSPDASPLMSQTEVAAFFGVTTRCVRYWDEQGELHPILIGGTLRYRRCEVEARAGITPPAPEDPIDTDQ